MCIFSLFAVFAGSVAWFTSSQNADNTAGDIAGIVEYRTSPGTSSYIIVSFSLNIVSESSVTYSVLVSYASNVYTVTVSSTSSLTFTFFCFQSGYSVTVNGSTLTFFSQVTTYAYSP